jgi:hypothetical protein
MGHMSTSILKVKTILKFLLNTPLISKTVAFILVFVVIYNKQHMPLDYEFQLLSYLTKQYQLQWLCRP